MELISKILIAIVALEHLYILYMEMFAWEHWARRLSKVHFRTSFSNQQKDSPPTKVCTTDFSPPDSFGVCLLAMPFGLKM